MQQQQQQQPGPAFDPAMWTNFGDYVRVHPSPCVTVSDHLLGALAARADRMRSTSCCLVGLARRKRVLSAVSPQMSMAVPTSRRCNADSLGLAGSQF